MYNWNKIEKQIYKEIEFLKNNILPSPYHQNDAIKCNDCILRYIAILIASGKTKVKKIICTKNIWTSKNYIQQINNNKKHGASWHCSTIKIVENYFEGNGHMVCHEPNLHYGRADLGISNLNIFIEIGTVNLYKLYCNLINMTNCKIIIMPFNNYLIEFSL